MARPKTIDLKAAEAKFVLEALYRDGLISSEVMSDYRGRYESEIHSLEARIHYLKTLATGAGAMIVGAAAAAAGPRVVRRVRKARVARQAAAKREGRPKKAAGGSTKKPAATKRVSVQSSDRKLIQKMQGRYLALLSKVPAGVKKRFGREAIEKKGKDAVVAEMETYVATLASKAKNARPPKQ